MTTIQEAKQALEAQQRQVAEQRKRLEEQQKKIQQQKLQALSRSQLMKQTPQSALSRQQQQRKLAQQKAKAVSKIKTAKTGIQQYEKEVLKPYESQIKSAVAAQAAAAKAKQYNTAVRVFLGQTSGSALKGIPADVIAKAKAQAEHYERAAYGKAWKSFQGEQQKSLQSIKELPSITVPGVTAPSLTNLQSTYNPTTGEYINAQGQGMSIAPQFVPSGVKIVGQDFGSYLSSLSTPQKFDIQKLATPSFETQQFDTYKDLGFTKEQSQILAKQPVSFTPEGARGFLDKREPLITKVDIQYLTTPKFKTQQQRDFYNQVNQPYKLETKRYRNLGYTPSQSQKLATESLKRGGISFTPERAEEIILKSLPRVERYGRIAGQKIEEGIVKVGEGISFATKKGFGGIKPLLEKEVKVKVLPIVPDVGLGITYGQAIASPVKGLEITAEAAGKGWTDIYSKTISKLPPEWKPSRVIVGKEEEYKELIKDIKEGKIMSKDIELRMEGLTIPYTAEQVGKGVEKVIGFGAYPIAAIVPGALPSLLVSETISAQQKYTHAEDLAKKEFEEDVYPEYLKTELKEGEELYSKKEFKEMVLPKLIEEKKSQAVVEGAIPAAFLFGGAAWKAGVEVKKFIPREKYTFGGIKFSQKQYEGLIKKIETSKIDVFKVEKDIFKVREEMEPLVPKKVFDFGGKGVSKEVVGSAEISTLADDLFNLKIFKSREEAINFVEGMSKTKSVVSFLPKSELDLMVGTLGDISKKVKLPKVSKEFVSKQESFTLSKAIKVKGEDRIINFNYNLGKAGKPIDIELSIVKVPKGSRYAELKIYEKGRVSKTIKEGPVYRLTDKLIADVGDMKVLKVDKDFLRKYKPTFRKVEFTKKRIPEYKVIEDYHKMPLKSDLKNLFVKGKKYASTEVIERISPRGVEAELKLLGAEAKGIGEVAVGFQKVAKVSDVRILGRGKGESELFKIPKPITFKEPIKKTAIEATFKERALVTKQVMKLEEPIKIVTPSKLRAPKAVIKSITISPTTKVPTSRELPLMVGGTGLKTIPYSGEGTYEIAEYLPAVREATSIEKVYVPADYAIIKPTTEFREISIIKPDISQGFISQLKPMEMLKVEQIPLLDQVPKLEQIPRLDQVPRVVQVPREAQVSKVAKALKITPVQRATPRITPRVTPRATPKPPVRPPTIRPKIKIPIVKLSSKKTKFVKPLKKKTLPKKGYGIEIRRKGKWEREYLPYSFATPEGAEAKAMDITIQEAAASYRIVKSKKPAKKSFRKPSAYQKVFFRPGKEPGVKVQKKLLRITTPGEVKEISLVGAATRRKKPINVLTLKPSILKPKSKKKKKGGKK